MCVNFELKIIFVEILKKKSIYQISKSILKILFGESQGRSMRIFLLTYLYVNRIFNDTFYGAY